jgi:hypothetical protein
MSCKTITDFIYQLVDQKKPESTGDLKLSGKTLKVRKIDSSEYQKFEKICGRWCDISMNKDLSGEIDDESRKIKDTFERCVDVSEKLEYAFSQGDQGLSRLGDEPFVCEDALGNTQGLFVLKFGKNKELRTCMVVTHPHNIRAKCNEKEIDRVSGVGAAILRFGAAKAIERGDSLVYVESSLSTKSFYEKFQFVDKGKIEETFTYRMEIEAEKLHDLLG